MIFTSYLDTTGAVAFSLKKESEFYKGNTANQEGETTGGYVCRIECGRESIKIRCIQLE